MRRLQRRKHPWCAGMAIIGTSVAIGALTIASPAQAPASRTADVKDAALATDLSELISFPFHILTCLASGSAGPSCLDQAGATPVTDAATAVPTAQPTVQTTLPQVPTSTATSPTAAAITTTTSASPTTTTSAAPITTSTGLAACPASERLDANKGTTTDEMISRVTYLDANCPSTAVVVTGHSYGVGIAAPAARHFGPSYTGHAKFVLNAGQWGDTKLLPKNTVLNCNIQDPVCSPQGSYATYFPYHMPDHYPLSYDDNPLGYNLINNGTIVEHKEL